VKSREVILPGFFLQLYSGSFGINSVLNMILSALFCAPAVINEKPLRPLGIAEYFVYRSDRVNISFVLVKMCMIEDVFANKDYSF